jgi:hypothetical protein
VKQKQKCRVEIRRKRIRLGKYHIFVCRSQQSHFICVEANQRAKRNIKTIQLSHSKYRLVAVGVSCFEMKHHVTCLTASWLALGVLGMLNVDNLAALSNGGLSGLALKRLAGDDAVDF